MSIIRDLKTKSLIVEIQSGVDKNGLPTFKKKSFSNIRLDATDADIHSLAKAISKVLAPETGDYLLDELSILSDAE
ncbi:DUF1659 domain-containing protein [Clostridium intestinale]|uniref:DUF1659 domain-containing protein n=1 Tax=Clostridium intestinale TaxID=36845 RepID=UPI0028F1466E|nr:DUF1659 domain-containing protein [Clostridium intestinale]